MKYFTIKIIGLSLVLFISLGNQGMAQSSITIDASQYISNFAFELSDGTQDSEYSPVYGGGYSLGYSYELDMGVFLNGGLGMRPGGATLVVDNTNYQWDLQYAQIRLGAGYAYDLGRIKPYIAVDGYYGLLLTANQRINNEDFDIIDSESIEKNDVGIYVSPGAKLAVSDAITVYAQYSYLLGLNNVETTTDGQNAKNRASVFTLGLSFSIEPLSK
ncbi:outer membrane beta-barrel protein [Marivirga salinae]|uniref:Outer membrane beta-barrel protein n=1 Tax=Marivirga salinarum TaxID=3059078 RepID=A0AA51RCF6_9BACT|nr:outer membrane beta-barrel protein [Marivirga sp. BDSF4-3]WMN11643.1 outer membrane beta-barrel protein [Marivirga sp. BDSF4-3]